jgi:hypothetical protein
MIRIVTMAAKAQSIENRVIPPQHQQPRRERRGRPPTSGVVPVLSRNYEDTDKKEEPIAGSSRITEGAGAAHTDTQVDLTTKTSAQAEELSAGPMKPSALRHLARFTG